MQYSSIIVAVFGFLAVGVHSLESPIPGYGVVDFEWAVESTPGGPNVTARGTIQDVYRRLTQINPNFAAEYPASPKTEINPVARRELDRRYLISHYTCFGQWAPAGKLTIEDELVYLSRVQGVPTNGPGPGNCGRVSCEENSGIWWCNDNSESKSLTSFGDIVNGAGTIWDNCGDDKTTAGQVFFTDNWNVIVKGESC